MNSFWLLLLHLCLLYLLLPFSLSSPSQVSTSDLFTTWCNQHGKSYSSEQEKQYRLKVFEDNFAFVNQHNNLGNSTYSLSLNAFADLTHHEFKASRFGLSVSAVDNLRFNGRPIGELDVVGDVPDSVDWRENGAVTHVKDQGSCVIGDESCDVSCWDESSLDHKVYLRTSYLTKAHDESCDVSCWEYTQIFP